MCACTCHEAPLSINASELVHINHAGCDAHICTLGRVLLDKSPIELYRHHIWWAWWCSAPCCPLWHIEQRCITLYVCGQIQPIYFIMNYMCLPFYPFIVYYMWRNSICRYISIVRAYYFSSNTCCGKVFFFYSLNYYKLLTFLLLDDHKELDLCSGMKAVHRQGRWSITGLLICWISAKYSSFLVLLIDGHMMRLSKPTCVIDLLICC